MNDRKILTVRVYQAVTLDGKSSTFFTTVDTPSRKAVQVEIINSVGVLIETETDAVIVPFANISGIYLDTKEKEEKRDAHIADISKPAKAQAVTKIKSDPKLK